MFESSTIRLRTKVSLFEFAVLQNRKSCKTDRARRAHDELALRLKEMQAGLDEVLRQEMKLVEAQRQGLEVDIDIDFIKAFFGLNWFGTPMQIMENAEPLSTEELQGLEELVALMEREILVVFTINRL